MNRIFISYRSSDGKKDAARLAADLNERFGEQLVFYDKQDLLGGTSWRDAINNTLGSQPVVLVLVTYAMFLMLEDITKLIWGANPYYVSEPYALFGNIDIGSQSYVGYDLLLVALAVLVGVLVWWGLNRTRFGKIVTALIHTSEIASSSRSRRGGRPRRLFCHESCRCW